MSQNINKNALRTNLFNEGQKALAALGINEDIYICPLCLDEHDRGSLGHDNGQEPQLTLEHVPPKSVDGKEIILTCKKCNNFAGHASDAHLAGAGRLHKRSHGVVIKSDGEYGSVKISAANITLNAQIEVKNGGYHFNIIEKTNNPSKIEQFADFMHGVKAGSEMTFTFEERSNPKRANFSLLRSAYLTMVAAFGYTYAFAQNIQKLRLAIINEQLDFPIRFVYPRNEPGNKIIFINDQKIALVQFGRVAVVMPFLHCNEESYQEITRSAPKISGQYESIKLPQSFIAQLDHSGRYSAKFYNPPAPDP